MNAAERKKFELPCGYTLEQSWAALRKSWLGFYIALSKGSSTTISKYASQIRKLQLEMGIELTIFEPGILDDDSIEEIEDIPIVEGEEEEPRKSCPYEIKAEEEEEPRKSCPYEINTSEED